MLGGAVANRSTKFPSATKFLSVSLVGLLAVVGTVVYSVYQVGIENQKLVELQNKQKGIEAQLTEKQKKLATLDALLAKTKYQLVISDATLKFAAEGVGYVHQGNFDQALQSYDSALTVEPRNVVVLNLKGYALFKKGDYKESIVTLEDAHQIDSNNPWPLLNLAKAQCAVGDFSGAKSSIMDINKSTPSFLDTVKGDGEFKRVCNKIYDYDYDYEKPQQ